MKKGRVLIFFDQVLASLGTLFISILLSRFFSVDSIVPFGIGLTLALVLQSFQRSLYVSNFNITDEVHSIEAVTDLYSRHFLFVILIILFLIILFHTQSLFKIVIIDYEIFLPFVLYALVFLQSDFDRVFFYKIGRPAALILFNSIYVFLVLLTFILLGGQELNFVYLLLISFLLLKMSFFGLVLTRFNFARSIRILYEDLRLRGFYAVENTFIFSAFNHLPVILLSLHVSPVLFAAFIVLRGFLQPAQLLIRAIDIFDKINIGLAKTQQAALKLVIRQSCRNLLIFSLFSFLFYLLGKRLFVILYGQEYSDYLWLGYFHLGLFFLISVFMTYESFLIKYSLYSRTFYVRLISAVMSSVLIFLLLPLFGIHIYFLIIYIAWLAIISISHFIFRGYVASIG